MIEVRAGSSEVRATMTDELRRLLDERGVEWMPSAFDPQHETFYDVNGVGFIVTEFPEIERMSLACDMRITPAQAIAATIGDVPLLPYFWTHDGTLHIELPKLPESISVRLPDHRDREVGSARTWRYTRDNETCHMEYCDEWSGDELYPTEAYVCSACSYVTVDGKPNYCPNCGRKVMNERWTNE